jgi:predicted O-methyltransferase YrrM
MIYLLAILNGATRIIECGTSFGVTTIYMALAVNQNKRGQKEKDFGVFTIEKDGKKVTKAKSIWKEAGEEVENCIDVREGDVLAVLAQDEILPLVVDLVFLDAWTSLALPALKLVLPRLRNGSVVVADRTIKGKILYHDFLTFVRDPANGFLSLTVPSPEGFEIMVYHRGRSS